MSSLHKLHDLGCQWPVLVPVGTICIGPNMTCSKNISFGMTSNSYFGGIKQKVAKSKTKPKVNLHHENSHENECFTEETTVFKIIMSCSFKHRTAKMHTFQII